MTKSIQLFLACCLLCCTQLNAAVTLGAYDIPTLLQKDGKGSYDLIFAEVNKIAGKNWRYQVLPPSRVDKDFASKVLDCIIPLDKDFFAGGNVMQSDFFNMAKIYIFTKEGSQPLAGVADLKGLKVGARRGMPYGPEFDAAGLKVNYSNTIEQNIKKVQAGRIDAFVAYVPDAWFAFKSLGLKMLPHNDVPMIVHEDGFLCHDTPDSRLFIKEFNTALTQLKNSGKLKTMLGDTYVKP